MRKYHQLLLVIISVFSVASLLVYRHEYLRLRYVLEVLNFFGSPTKPELLALNNTAIIATSTSWGPLPTWQRIDDNHYVYSAFWTKNNEVKAIAISLKNVNVKLTCNLWYDNSAKPIMGKFSHSLITKNDDFSLYVFYCKQRKYFGEPFAVSFLNSPLISLRINIEKQTHNTSVCVTPTDTIAQKSSVVDFIAYNQLMGVNEFLFYDNRIPFEVITSLQRVSTSLNFSLTVIPWNFPGSQSNKIRDIIEKDCLFRASSNSKNIMILSLNEYVIPKYHKSILALLSDLNTSKYADRLLLSALTFCTDTLNHKLLLESTDFIKNVSSSNKEFYIYRGNYKEDQVTISTQAISTEFAALHRYVTCNAQKTFYDASGLQFIAELNKTPLKKLYLSQQLF